MIVWGWFLTTKAGRWLLAIGAVLLAAFAAFAGGFEKGKYAEAKKAADARVKAAQDAAKSAQATRKAAQDAMAKVQADAAKQPPPDASKRNDFDGTF